MDRRREPTQAAIAQRRNTRSGCPALPRQIVLLASLFAVGLHATGVATAQEIAAPTVAIRDGRLTVRARNVSFSDLVAALGKAAGIRIHIHPTAAPVTAGQRV